MPRPRLFPLHDVMPEPGAEKTLKQKRLEGLEKKWGLKNGITLESDGSRYFYVRCLGVITGSKPTVYAYKYYKNGNTHSRLDILEEWEIVK